MHKAIKNIEKEVMAKIHHLSKKEIIMAIMALHHIKNHEDFMIGAGISASALSYLPAFVIDLTPAGQAALLAIGTCCTTKTILDAIDNHKVNKYINQLIEELMSRYEVPQVAYLETSELITSTTREEIIDYLDSIGCEHNYVK